MTYSYISTIRWSQKEGVHGEMELDRGPSFDFHKPSEFGGRDGFMNPEDAFVGSVAMCYSITVEEMCIKMRLNIDHFELKTVGILEEVDGKNMITKIILRPEIRSLEKPAKIKRALELAKENCLIARSLTSEIKLEPVY